MKHSRDVAWLIRHCQSEPNCYRYLRKRRWRGLGPFCLKCRSPQLWIYPQSSGRNDYICRKCRFHFNDLTATPLHGLRTPLKTYFRLVFLVVLFRDIPTPVLAALCDINPKTALRLRNACRYIVPEYE